MHCDSSTIEFRFHDNRSAKVIGIDIRVEVGLLFSDELSQPLNFPRFVSPAVCALLTLPAALFAAGATHWPAWRGPLGTGITAETNLPVKWSKTENVRWRVPLPERGNSTPIVWGGRIFLTQSIGNKRTLRCVDRADGRTLWQQDVATQLTDDPTHQTNPYCSSSPVTDGERVIVWHGSDGLHCYDLDGKKLWSRDLGVQRHIWGYGSSPAIHGDFCFLNFGPGKTRQNWSSVLLSGDNCYTITQGGDCFIFKASPKFELVAVNSLGEPSNSSLVPSNGELFIRTHAALWCIAAKR